MGLGVALIVLVTAIAILSKYFFYGGDPFERPTIRFVALSVASGAVYLGAVFVLCRIDGRRWLIVYVVVVGVVLRAVLLASTPILEDDFYRYMWDGAVTANGHNAFRYSPGDVQIAALPDGTDSELYRLAQTGPIERVNHPRLGTIYPPVAQAVFAVAHWIAPWNLFALRAVLLLFDAATFAIVLALLREIGRPLHWGAIYWWNPLLIVETVNSAHMDAIVLPFVAGALWFSIRKRPYACGISLAFAAAVKLWPVMLAPMLFRGMGLTPKRAIAATGISLGALAALMWPMVAAKEMGMESGFAAYGERWEMNDALFVVFHKSAEWTGRLLDLDAQSVRLLVRGVAASVLGAIVIALSLRAPRDARERCTRVVLAIGAMFMLIPAPFPWYYAWLVPFLTLSPRPAFLALSVMLPLYYLKFYFDARGNVDFFHSVIVWIEFAPILALLAYEGLTVMRSRRTPAYA